MSEVFNARQAKAAANIVLKCPSVKSRRALESLAKFCDEQHLFDNDAVDAIEVRRLIEEKHERNPQQHHSFPLMMSDREARILQLENKARATLDSTAQAFHSQQLKVNVVDSSSPNYQDPDDGRNTKLHKLVLDQDIHQIKHYVEVLGANLFILNNDGLDPEGLALNMGYFDVANYLRQASKIAAKNIVAKVIKTA